MARVEVKTHGSTANIEVDGRQLEADIQAYAIRHKAGEMPIVELELLGYDGAFEIENANVSIKDYQKILQKSATIMRNEFLKHGDWYNALVKSITGYLMGTQGNARICDIAEGLAKRLIGDEEYGTD